MDIMTRHPSTKKGTRCLLFVVFFTFIYFSALAQLPKPKWVDDLGGPFMSNAAAGRCLVTAMVTDAQNNVYITGEFNGTVDFDPSSGVKNLISRDDYDVFIGKYKQDGTLIWVESIGADSADTPQGDSRPNGIAVDGAGNISVTGYFDAPIFDADPGPGLYNLSNSGGFLVHLDNNGTFLWATTIGVGHSAGGEQVFTDSHDDVIVTANYGTSLTIGDSTYIRPQGTANGLIVKYDPAGNVLWNISIGNTGANLQGASGCHVDSQDNIVISGIFNSTSNFNPLGAAYHVTTSARNAPFVAKYSPSGGLIWVNAINSSITFVFNQSMIGIDQQDNIYFTTSFVQSIIFNGSLTLNAKGNQDVCFAKYSPSGILQRAESIGGAAATAYNCSVVTDRNDNIYLTGYFNGTINFNPNTGATDNLSAIGNNFYVAQYDAKGNYVYAFDGGGKPLCDNLISFGISIDTNNNLDLAGEFCSTVNFDPSGCVSDTVTAINPESDGFMAQYGPSAIANNIITAPVISSFCVSGTPAPITGSSPTGGSGVYTYQWQSSADSINFVSITGATGQNYTQPTLTATSYFQRTVNAGTCTPPLASNIVALTITPPPAAPVVPAANGCIGSTATLSVTSPQTGYTYNWYTSATGDTSVFTGVSFTTPALTDSMTYYATATNSIGCVSATRTAATVIILPPLAAPVVKLGPTTASIIVFEWAAVPGATGYQVSIDNGQTWSPVSGLADTVSGLQAGQTVSILVQATGVVPCQLSAASVAVAGLALSPTDDVIYVPNVFTPNGDGTNDIAHAHGDNIANLRFYIYDQWGELIFTSTSVQNGWDGTYKGAREPVGVYVYYVQATMKDGKNITEKGSITLIR